MPVNVSLKVNLLQEANFIRCIKSNMKHQLVKSINSVEESHFLLKKNNILFITLVVMFNLYRAI